MKKCRGKNLGIILIVFGIGIILCLILPMKLLAVLLTAIIIYVGFLIK